MHAADKPALILGDETLTHGQFQVLKDQVVAALQRDGIAPGDVIAICAATSLAYAVTFMGCVQCGVVVAPLAPSSSAQDLAAMLANAQAKRLFTDAEKAKGHIAAGARKVIISAPATNPFVLAPNTAGTDIRRSDDKFRWHSLRATAAFRF